MTVGEILDYLKIKGKQRSYELRERAEFDYVQSVTIYKFVASLLVKDAPIPPTLLETYPDYFSEEIKEEVEKQKQIKKAQQIKERLRRSRRKGKA